MRESWRGADGSRYAAPATGFHDTVLNADCSPFYTAADGVQRCLPINDRATVWIYSSVFADATCSIAAGAGAMTCTPRFFVTPRELFADTCGVPQYGYAIFRVGAKVTTVYQWNYATPRACVVAASADPGTGKSWYAADTEIPPTDFVAFTRE